MGWEVFGLSHEENTDICTPYQQKETAVAMVESTLKCRTRHGK